MIEMHQGTVVVTQPPHFPTMHTRETVTHLAAFGLDEKQVAVILKCTVDDVRKYYMEEMEHGLTRINAQVMNAVLHAALYEDSAADRKLWLVNRAGWKSGDGNKNVANNVTLNANGEPISNGEYTVVQRRELITTLLTKATALKRSNERVVEGHVVNRANGSHTAKSNGANGHGANGGNGVKHK